jgi:hypothetical protein
MTLNKTNSLWPSFLRAGFFLCLGVFSSPAQTPPPGEIPPTFSLLNIVKSPSPVKVSIGGTPVGIGEMPFGFHTGIVNWYPLAPITIEAQGMKPAEIAPDAKTKPGEVPLYVAIDAKEQPADGGKPVPVVKVIRVAPAASRPSSFVDAVNLTTKDSLELSVGRNPISLTRSKRVRISQQNGAAAKVLPDGPEVQISAAEEGGIAAVVIFYEDLEGKINYSVASDPVIRP